MLIFLEIHRIHKTPQKLENDEDLKYVFKK